MGRIAIVAALIVVAAGSAGVAELNDVFTYQGEIEKDGAPVNGSCEFRFRIFDAVSGGTQTGLTQNLSATVVDGLFSVLINTNDAFDGTVRFLDIGARCPAGTGSFDDLAPRQQLTAAPYAFYAPDAGLAGALDCLGCVDSSRLGAGAVTDQKVAAGISYSKLSGVPLSLPPSGAAGGGLAGVYPNPSVAGGAVGTFQLLNGAVTSEKIALAAVGPSHLSFTPGTVQSITAGTGLTGGTITDNGSISVAFGETSQTVAAGDHQHGGDFWKLGGNAGTTAGTDFLGTTDGSSLELRVNNQRSLSMEPVGPSINWIAGAAANSRTSGISGATVGGGGTVVSPNAVHSDYATVSGGRGNDAWMDATVGGGRDNEAGDLGATVGGGAMNVAMATHSTVGGGLDNTAVSPAATVGGGESNSALGLWSTIGGGEGNDANGAHSVVGGGQDNQGLAIYATIAGGGRSDPQNPDSANRVTDDYGTIGGGGDNTAGNENVLKDDAVGATVGGGGSNTAGAPHTTVGGGFLNGALGDQAVVGGGTLNLASGPRSTVPGGVLNSAEAEGTFAAGANAHATHIGSFVWSDGTTFATSAGPRTFNAVAAGGFRFVVNGNGDVCTLSSTSGWSCGGGSDRHRKENVNAVDPGEILSRVARIPISTWSYKSEGSAVRHIGPMAQDFYREFQLGADDRHIGTVDADGVALAAIQGLSRLVEQQHREIDTLRARGEALELRLLSIEARLPSLDDDAPTRACAEVSSPPQAIAAAAAERSR